MLIGIQTIALKNKNGLKIAAQTLKNFL